MQIFEDFPLLRATEHTSRTYYMKMKKIMLGGGSRRRADGHGEYWFDAKEDAHLVIALILVMPRNSTAIPGSFPTKKVYALFV